MITPKLDVFHDFWHLFLAFQVIEGFGALRVMAQATCMLEEISRRHDEMIAVNKLEKM